MSLELQFAAEGRSGISVPLGEPTLTIGSLTSNQVVLEGPGVEPIHCLIEPLDAAATSWRVVDLGTLAGVKVNGRRIDVEAVLAPGDILEIGSRKLTLAEVARGASVSSGGEQAAPSGSGPANDAAAEIQGGSALQGGATAAPRGGPLAAGGNHSTPFSRLRSRLLFAPRPSSTHQGRLLEVVAYWGDTVLNVDHFHPTFKGFDSVTIGDPTKAHFLSGGREFFKSRVLADVESERCVLRLTADMSARVRKDGKLRKVSGGDKSLSLGPRDYAHVEYGPIHYFLHFANPPKVELPNLSRRDALLSGLSLSALVLYLVLVTLAVLTKPTPIVIDPNTGIWDPVPTQDHKPQLVSVHLHTEHVTPPPPVHPVPPVQQQRHELPHPQHVQPPQHIVQQSLPPPVPQPAPPPHPVPPQPQVAPAPVPQPQTAQHETHQPPVALSTPHPTTVPSQTPKAGAQSPATAHPSTATGKAGKSGSAGPSGAPGGDKRPAPNPGNTGGPGAHNAQSGPLKGTQSFNNPGVEGATKNQPSMPNLKQLGVGLGQVLNKPGGIHADFKSSAGGIGGKAGTASHDLGLGTPGQGTSLDVPGAASRLGSWGNGPGGLLGSGGPGKGGFGQHGPGGPGLGDGPGGPGSGPGLAMGTAGGHKAANVTLPPQEPVTSRTYSPDWVLQVIRQHLNEIRHCYEQTLQRAPNTAGKIKVGFTIGLNGRVTTVSVLESDIDDMMMRGCITGHIQRWAFPKPVGTTPVQVRDPFVLRPIN